ncbi:hypothetical protein [Actinopolymorpha alba]|uniref:hypothetical protein n=1 Tax=Actinopolymorpha alba TaxID=533267 RepID=UPI00036133FB|nr:hypothetical protein [Actinopolymorpha alba]
MSESSCLVGQASGEVSRGWIDRAGDEFRERLTTGIQHINDFYEDIRRMADVLDRYADALEQAQRKIDKAREIVDGAEYLDVVGGVVHPPTNELLNTGSDQYDYYPRIERDAYLRAMQKYVEVAGLIKGARAMVIEQDGFLERITKELSEKRYFIAGDLVAGQAEYLADLFEARFVQVAGQFDASAAENLARSARIMDSGQLPTIRKILSATSRSTASVGNVLAGTARAGAWGMGWVSRVSKFGGPGLMIVGVGIDLYTGKPPEKVAFSVAGGYLGMGVVLIVVTLAGPPAWAAAGGMVVGGVLGGLGGDWVYDHTRPTPLIIDDNWAYQPE